MTALSKDRVFIIAEAGVNHNGDLELAQQLVDAAAISGADAVKFQTFTAAKLVTRTAKQADYQVKNLGHEDGQFEMLQRLELDLAAHKILIAHCKKRGIRFLSTPFDDDSIDLLLSLGMDLWKIPSGEITNLPYLRRIGSLGHQIILSTGMSTIGEIERALDVIEIAGTPRSNITLLHCTTEYPAPLAEVNLRSMQTIGKVFGIPVGYSDHTQGIEISIAAAALGAVLIEKHFTLDRSLPGPDHIASLEPKELTALVTGIRKVEVALGSEIKRPTVSELRNVKVARKSIVAACNIRKGEQLTEANLTTKRPGTGIDPMRWDEVIGTSAVRDFSIDDAISLT